MSLFEDLYKDARVVDSLGRHQRYVAPFWRLWHRLDRSDGPDSCWPFSGHRNPAGYGQLSLGRKKGLILAHRLAYMAYQLRAVPDGLGVLHSCDNPPCCNPRHLRVGSQAANVADMLSRGREARLTNELSPSAKLSDAEVAEIRARVASGATQKSVARLFGVHPAHVSRIVNERRRPL